jgi:hypothetical protein
VNIYHLSYNHITEEVVVFWSFFHREESWGKTVRRLGGQLARQPKRLWGWLGETTLFEVSGCFWEDWRVSSVSEKLCLFAKVVLLLITVACLGFLLVFGLTGWGYRSSNEELIQISNSYSSVAHTAVAAAEGFKLDAEVKQREIERLQYELQHTEIVTPSLRFLTPTYSASCVFGDKVSYSFAYTTPTTATFGFDVYWTFYQKNGDLVSGSWIQPSTGFDVFDPGFGVHESYTNIDVLNGDSVSMLQMIIVTMRPYRGKAFEPVQAVMILNCSVPKAEIIPIPTSGVPSPTPTMTPTQAPTSPATPGVIRIKPGG